MKNFKKILSSCIIALVVIATAVTSTIIFAGKGKGGVPAPETQKENINWLDYGVYFASAEEAAEVDVAPESMKGGAVYIGPGTVMNITGGTIEYHEAMYGGAFFVDEGAVLNISGGTIRCNGAMWGGAIFVNQGGTLNITGGSIEYNSAEEGPAIFARGACEINYGEGVDLKTLMSKNEYADYGEFEIRYYVDGFLADYSEQKIAAFKTDEAPLSYAECNGWFLDEEMTEPIEEGDVISYSGTPDMTVMGVESVYKRVINVYTKTATIDKLTFTELKSKLGYSVAAKAGITGDVVIPREYEGKSVSLANSAFSSSMIDNVKIPSSITEIPTKAFEKSTIKTINLTENIVIINSYAFDTCESLNSIVLQSSVTSINSAAFKGCSVLTELIIPDSVTTIRDFVFSGCTALESIELPDSVTTISANVFLGCTALQSIELPDGVATIGAYAFSGCTALQSIELPNSVTTIGYDAFYSCTALESITLPDSVTTIGDSAFSGCTALQSIELPDSVTGIAVKAFKGCINLKSVKLSSEMEKLTTSLFEECTSLTSISILNEISQIDPKAFKNCTSLKEITIGENVATIYDNTAFEGCTGLEIINYNSTKITNFTATTTPFSSVGKTGELVVNFNTSIIPGYALYNNTNVKEITIGENVATIKANAFTGCYGVETLYYNSTKINKIESTNQVFNNMGKLGMYKAVINTTLVPWFMMDGNTRLHAVEFGDKVTTINDASFKGCTMLTVLTIGNKVTTIGSLTFSGCTSLKEVTIPNSVTSLGIESFSNCIKLQVVNYNAGIVQNLTTSSKVFNNAGDSNGFVLNVNSKLVPLGLFYGNTKLKAINIGGSVEEIGSSAFRDATNLENVDFTNATSLAKINITAFYKCTKIESLDFTNCSALTVMDDQAFGYCSGLESVVLPINNGYLLIEDLLFENCSSLKQIVIPEQVTRVRYSAFINCVSLASVTFAGTNVTSVDGASFNGCTALTSIDLPEGIIKIYSFAFNNTGLTSIILPSTAQRIGANCFNTCTSVTFTGDALNHVWQIQDNDDEVLEQNVDISNPIENATKMKTEWIPDGETETYGYYYIRDDYDGYVASGFENFIFTLNDDGESYSVAAGHTGLSGEITIPSEYNGKPVTAIADNGFKDCVNVTEVYIAENIEVIGSGAFVGCSKLTDIYIVFPQINDLYYYFKYLGDNSKVYEDTESSEWVEQFQTKYGFDWVRGSEHSG